MIGARPGTPTRLNRLIAHAMASTLTAFVIPDVRIAGCIGLDLPAVGLEVVATPRHAMVLVVIGELPPRLLDAATVVYAQMPRPRFILAMGGENLAPLPPADVTTSLDQVGLVDGVRRLRTFVSHGSWEPIAAVFTAPALDETDGTDEHGMPQGDDRHAADSGQEMGAPAQDHGSPEATCGAVTHDHMAMAHAVHDNSSATAAMDQDAGPAEHTARGHTDHAGHEPMPPDAAAHANHAGMDHGSMHHGDQMMSHGDHMMDHGADGGFMSMIAMTQDLPRSCDGLPMEWIKTAFGPLFPGFPGGLAPMLTLDGDTVAAATLTTGITYRDLATSLPGPVGTFPDRLSVLDPLAPVAYRLLAERALGVSLDPYAASRSRAQWIGALERERAINHLGWLAAFGALLGIDWLATRAAGITRALVGAPDIATIHQLRTEIDRLLRDTERIPLLGRRLIGIGALDQAAVATARGPVARASGVATDARGTDPAYQALGFVPVLRDGGDVLARLQVRLAEISQSLNLVAAAGAIATVPATISPDMSGTGIATVETPRGTATLHLEVDHGHVHAAHVQTPSAANSALVPPVAEGAEVADALVAIASLDLSPWEIDQ